jgi:hypothetical protein
VNIKSCRVNNIDLKNFAKKRKEVSFTSAPLYAVKTKNPIKNTLPVLAFLGSALGALGYLIGGSALLYDLNKEKSTTKVNEQKDNGVKTIKTSTKIGKIGMNCTKIGMTATAISGIACGLGEGIPLMALGEATNLGSAKIIETPIGTGLFGIGIASIFAGLALDNTPNLKLNEFELMAEKKRLKKAKIYLKNMLTTGKEIGLSIFQIARNIFNPKWIKENILQGSPKTVVFSEAINKDGKVILTKMLRHNKNYLMHASSFTLGLGGFGLIISNLLNKKKAERASLQVEEAGFLFDNVGMTRYGLDKLTNGSKSSGIGYAIGGIINAISQIIGIDNKDGRALQWLGIGIVFMGYTVDRGKHLKEALKLTKQRPELTRVIREWKFDLSNLVKDKKELKKLLKEIKNNKNITNDKFITFENSFKNITAGNYKTTETVKEEVAKYLDKNAVAQVTSQEIADYNKTKKILEICTEKIFGSKNPKSI